MLVVHALVNPKIDKFLQVSCFKNVYVISVIYINKSQIKHFFLNFACLFPQVFALDADN